MTFLTTGARSSMSNEATINFAYKNTKTYPRADLGSRLDVPGRGRYMHLLGQPIRADVPISNFSTTKVPGYLSTI